MNDSSRNPYIRCIATCLMVLAMAACSGGGSSSPGAAAPSSITLAESGGTVAPGSSVFTLTQIAIAEIDPSNPSVSMDFISADNITYPLISNQASADQFWLPVVPVPTAGNLTISTSEGAPFSTPLTLLPYPASGVAGEAMQNFLQSSLFTMNSAIDSLNVAARPLPELLQASQAARNVTRQMLVWVTDTMRHGSTSMAQLKDGRSVTMTREDLKALDQMVLRAGNMRFAQTASCVPNRAQAGVGAPAQVSTPNDLAWCLAMVQTTNEATFASLAKSIGEALGVAADMALKVSAKETGAFRQDADAQAVDLFMAGLYTAHYGNGLAMILTLQTASFSAANQALIQDAIDSLFVGLINEIRLPDLDLDAFKAGDATATLIRNTGAAINKAAVEDIIIDIIQIYGMRVAGFNSCPVGTIAVPDPDSIIFGCVSP